MAVPVAASKLGFGSISLELQDLGRLRACTRVTIEPKVSSHLLASLIATYVWNISASTKRTVIIGYVVFIGRSLATTAEEIDTVEETLAAVVAAAASAVVSTIPSVPTLSLACL